MIWGPAWKGSDGEQVRGQLGWERDFVGFGLMLVDYLRWSGGDLFAGGGSRRGLL